jgi:hypothetical protein
MREATCRAMGISLKRCLGQFTQDSIFFNQKWPAAQKTGKRIDMRRCIAYSVGNVLKE